MADKSVFGSTTRVFVLTPMTSFQSSTMSEADTIDDFVVADSLSAAATGDACEEAAAAGDGSAQPEAFRSAESPLPPAHQVLMSKKRSKQMDQQLNPMDQQLPATVLPI